MLATATITYDIADLTGVDFDARRTRVWVTTNIPDGTIADTVGNQVRIGDGRGSLADDGTGSVTVWVPGTGSNPASWQTTLHVDYQPRGGGGRVVRNFGPYTITGDANLADLVAEQAVPAAAVGGDAAVAGFVSSSTSATRAALTTPVTAITNPLIGDAIAGEIGRADATYAERYDQIWIPATDMWPLVGTEERGYGGTATPHVISGWLLSHTAPDFNNSEGVSYVFKLPRWATKITQLDVYWSCPTAAGNLHASFGANFYSFGSGNPFDLNSSTLLANHTSGGTTATRLAITSLPGTGGTAATVDPTLLTRMKLYRNATSGTDTITTDVLLVGVLLTMSA